MSKKIINKSKRIQEYKKAIEIKEKQLSDIKKKKYCRVLKKVSILL